MLDPAGAPASRRVGSGGLPVRQTQMASLIIPVRQSWETENDNVM